MGGMEICSHRRSRKWLRLISSIPLWTLLMLPATISACRNSQHEAAAQRNPKPEGFSRAPAGEDATGRWHPLQEPNQTLSLEQREAMSRLVALGYLQGTQPAPEKHGVTVFKAPRVQPGLNLFNSGHAAEAFLTDLDGRVQHRWSFPIDSIWPEQRGTHQSSYWRRVTWLPNGDVLAIFEGIGLIRLDQHSNLRWAYPGAVHHQAIVGQDGTIWTLTRHSKILPGVDESRPVLEDRLARLSPSGELIEEISLLEAFEGSSYEALLQEMRQEGDLFHTNSLQILDGLRADRVPWLRRGNVLLSSFFLDTLFVLDPEQKKVVWALRGDGRPAFRGQHDPRLLPNGRLLLLDNWGHFGKSKVIEFDPLTLEVAWQYPATAESDFFTPTCGTSQRLANGNTLITESDKDRAFEVDPQGEIVWEFFNPHRAGAKQELIATLFELKRVREDFFVWR